MASSASNQMNDNESMNAPSDNDFLQRLGVANTATERQQMTDFFGSVLGDLSRQMALDNMDPVVFTQEPTAVVVNNELPRSAVLDGGPNQQRSPNDSNLSSSRTIVRDSQDTRSVHTATERLTTDTATTVLTARDSDDDDDNDSDPASHAHYQNGFRTAASQTHVHPTAASGTQQRSSGTNSTVFNSQPAFAHDQHSTHTSTPASYNSHSDHATSSQHNHSVHFNESGFSDAAFMIPTFRTRQRHQEPSPVTAHMSTAEPQSLQSHGSQRDVDMDAVPSFVALLSTDEETTGRFVEATVPMSQPANAATTATHFDSNSHQSAQNGNTTTSRVQLSYKGRNITAQSSVDSLTTNGAAQPKHVVAQMEPSPQEQHGLLNAHSETNFHGTQSQQYQQPQQHQQHQQPAHQHGRENLAATADSHRRESQQIKSFSARMDTAPNQNTEASRTRGLSSTGKRLDRFSRADLFPPPFPKPSVSEIRRGVSPGFRRSSRSGNSSPQQSHDNYSERFELMQRYEQQLAQQAKRITQLEAEILNLKEQLQQAHYANAQHQQVQHEMENATRLRHDAEQKHQALHLQNVALQAELNTLKQQQGQFQHERHHLTHNAETAQAEVAKLHGEIRALRQQNNDLQDKLLVTQQHATATQSALEDFRRQFSDEARRSEHRLAEQRTEWNSREQHLTTELEALQQTMRSEMELHMRQLSAAQTQHQQEQHMWQEKINQIAARHTHEMQALQSELNQQKQAQERQWVEKEHHITQRLEREWAEKLRNKTEELHRLQESHLAQSRVQEADFQTMEARVAESETRLRELNNELQRMQAKSHEASQAAASANAQLKQVTDEMQHCKLQLSQKDAQCARSLEELNQLLQARDQEVGAKDEEILAAVSQVHQLEAQTADMQLQIDRFETMRRKMHNTIQELKGNIRVFCRVRPPLTRFGEQPPEIPFQFHTVKTDDGQERLDLLMGADMGGRRTKLGVHDQPKLYTFAFDRVFQGSDQNAVFEEIEQLVQSVLDGYRVCIFAYGQTGSGKTYTMEGNGNTDASMRGVIPRTVEKIFCCTSALQRSHGWKFRVMCSFIEIYNDDLRDLLANGNAPDKRLEIKHLEGGKTVVSGANVVCVREGAEVLQLLQQAAAARAVAETRMNDRSSRSHSVFRLEIEGECSKNGETMYGILNLIDLAGSERLSQSESTGTRRKEAQHINKSLYALADVISSLANKEPHIPYRNSKLTYLLQESLGGDCKMLMFANLSSEPQFVGESLCTLRFADKVNHTHIGSATKHAKVNLGQILSADSEESHDGGNGGVEVDSTFQMDANPVTPPPLAQMRLRNSTTSTLGISALRWK